MIPVRMPLFFFVSGILAHRAIRRKFSALLRPRFLNLIWPFVLWSVIYSFLAGYTYSRDDQWAYTKDSLATIVFGGNAYWFLSVLLVFFTVAYLFKNRIPILFIAALTLYATAPAIKGFLEGSLNFPEALSINVSRVAYFAVWYLAGLLIVPKLSSISHVFDIKKTVVLAVSFLSLAVPVYFLGMGKSNLQALYSVTSLVGVGFFIGVSVWLQKYVWAQNVSKYVASRTLPIYVIHPILLLLNILLFRFEFFGPVQTFLSKSLVTAFFFPLYTILLLVLSLAAYELLLKFRLRFLFEPPGRL